MARIGVFCFAGVGHLNPMTALGRRLQERGHEVVIFGIADVEARVRAAGLAFCRIGQSDYPPGTLQKLDQRLAELSGLKTFRYTVERVKNTTRMVLRDGPEAVRSAKIDVLLVDEADMAGNVAEHLAMPFVSVALFPPLTRDDRIPPFCFGWQAEQDSLSRLRNRFAFGFLGWIASPIFRLVNEQRRAWGLRPLKHSTEALSPLAQITQLPAALEFDLGEPPALVHYTGPFVDAQARPKIDFPWEQLDGRPLIYASMGTLQNGSETIFRKIAEGCADLDAQLIISLGGGLDNERFHSLPGNPIVVRYAPQLELVQRAAAVITHAGLNTALESLAQGVPLVCIPMGNDQPGVAARVVARGAGVAIPRHKLTADRLRFAVRAVLEDEAYRRAAKNVQAGIQSVDGLEKAADIIEAAFRIGKSAPQASMTETADQARSQ